MAAGEEKKNSRVRVESQSAFTAARGVAPSKANRNRQAPQILVAIKFIRQLEGEAPQERPPCITKHDIA